MAESDPKADLHRYLRRAREAVLWKLDGLSEYDVRRPLTPTGTNLLGLVKHLATMEYGYFGDCFGRPPGEPLPWTEEDAWYSTSVSMAPPANVIMVCISSSKLACGVPMTIPSDVNG